MALNYCPCHSLVSRLFPSQNGITYYLYAYLTDLLVSQSPDVWATWNRLVEMQCLVSWLFSSSRYRLLPIYLSGCWYVTSIVGLLYFHCYSWHVLISIRSWPVLRSSMSLLPHRAAKRDLRTRFLDIYMYRTFYIGNEACQLYNISNSSL